MDLEEIKKEKALDSLLKFQDEFLKDRLKEVVKLRELFNKKDYGEVSSMAHKWKGFSEPYGFQTLGKLSREIEKLIESNDFKACDKVISDIEEYLSLKRKVLESNVD